MKKHGLPVSRDAFIGRTGALEDLHTLMMGGQHLVTVLGMGGTGKTRLAIRYGWITWTDGPEASGFVT